MILETDISAVLTFAGRNLIDSASSSSRIEITEFGIISNSQNEGAVADPNTTSVTELARYPWIATLSIDGENALVRCEIPRDEGPWNIGGVSLYVGSTLIGLFYWPSRWVKPAGTPGSQRFFELVLSRGGISGKLVTIDASLPYVRDISDLPPISTVNQNKIYVVSNRSASLAPDDQWVIAYPQNGSWNTSVVTLTVPPRPSSQSIGPFYSDTPAPTTTAEQSHLLQYSSKYGLPIDQMGELVADGNFGFLFSDGSGKIRWVHPKDYLARSNRDGFMPAEIFAGGLNADRLGGFYPSRDPDPNTIPVRDAGGNITGGLLGNADTATRLQTPVTIAGQPFDGTQNVIVTADNVHSGTFPGSYSFVARPSFAGNVPWDSGNFNPNSKLDKFSAEDLTFDLSDGSQKNINFWYGAGNGGSSLYARGDTGRVGMWDDASSRVIWEYNPTGAGSYFFGGTSMSLNGNQVWHQGNFDPNLKANLDSPAFTGIPTAPTASLGVITDQIATTKFVYDVVEDQLVSLLSFRGGFTPAAASGTDGYPAGGGSGPLGEIRVGDAFVADSDGWILDKEIHAGDWVIAKVDNAGQDEDDWTTLNSNLTYVPEDQANKVTSFSSPTDVQYPSAKLVKDNLDLKLDKFSTESLVFDTQLSSKSITFSFGTGNGGISITSDAVDRNLEFWDQRESRLILEYNPATGGSLISDVPDLSLNGNLVWHQGNFNPNDKASLDGTSVLIPSGSTATRPVSPLGTSIRFNTDTSEFEGWNGSTWGPISEADAAAARTVVAGEGLDGGGDLSEDIEIFIADSGVTDAKVYTPASADDPGAVKATKIAFLQGGTGAVERFVQDKLREWVSVKDFGAVGDGVTDDTAAFQKAADSPHTWVIVPDGIYLVDTVIITRKKCWELGPSAIVKMRSPHAGIRAVFDFMPGAAGSSIRGGIIDGNRDELGPHYADRDWLWTGLRALNVHDFTVEDVTFQNCVAFGFWLQGNRMLGRNLRVVASGKGSQIKRVTDGHFSGLDFTDIGNAGLDVYQHANEWRHLENVSFEGISIKDFQPDTTGLEPNPEAIALEECRRLSFSNVLIDGFHGTSISGYSIGFYADTVDSMSICGLHVIGYTDGVHLNSCASVSVTNFHLDGGYIANASYGINVQNAGIIESPVGDLSGNARSPHPSRHVSFSNGTVKRFNVGASVRGSHVSFSQTDIFGNVADGLQLDRSPSNGLFGGTAKEVAGAIDLDSTVSIFNNGRLGVLLDQWTDFRANGARIENNGQNAAEPENRRCGVATLNDTGLKGRVLLENCRLGDTQAFTLSDAASFIPGATDANNRKAIFFNNLSGIYEGQWVRLVGAAAGGSDIVAKVVSIDLTQMAAVVETSAPATFSEVGNISTLTGTFDTVGQVLTGTGSQLLSEGLPFAILKANGEYRVLRRVNSDTDGLLEEPFSSDLSGATVQIIKIDVAGIPSQLYGERWTNLPPGSIVSRANRYTGVVQTPTNLSTPLVYGPESEVYLSTGASGVAMNTIGSITSPIQGLPEGWIPVAWRTEITEAITGTDATLYYEFRDSAGIRKSLTSNTAYAVGSKSHGEVHSDPFVGQGAISIRLAGGSSNVASGGRVRAEIICRVPRLPAFT